MATASLTKGANAALAGTSVELVVDARGTESDVSALLLGSDQKVRTDDDLVFYNNPSKDGVSISGKTVSVQLSKIPRDVASVVVVVSADPTHPDTVFTTAPALTVNHRNSESIEFRPPDFVSRETVVVLAELYRRDEGWKVRAVGQGYASGLGGLATDYGVDVDADDERDPSAVSSANSTQPSSNQLVNLSKVENRAPALLGAARQAGQALSDAGVTGRRAAIYLVLAHDYGMEELYDSFAIQAFAERILAVSANLDDDGTVPVIFSGSREPFLEDMDLDNYRGRIGQLHTQVDWGWGHTVEAMRLAASHYQSSGARDPAIVLVQVSDEPSDKAEIRSLLQNTAALGVFWMFVGFGRGKLEFFKNLNASRSATFRNVSFYDAGKNPGAVPDEKFYSKLANGLAAWLR
ncbi:VWA domain-containing protein [Pseudonocardia sp. KRD-184]|uniref:VWA domain-containing protein n=1 Tax=Pseudonocardia oceani TaxID=2792013 RepID=A0ABS6U8M0_9PSEU|nr:VWA domain-containing protein [Pseudonocardia oceani]MBW0090648.1 VWA domain-containing protein [Pseudonocardia oceani]MBW0097768.1 VWA domain-containing protein [Pseudonocardia oceani]MBW0108580.1 VWA domain-containing protein [Pseudonocardia oceani]MBW0122316.1 VWA domain-containing protein [Pseudonocardia oceani]MBW0128596.1 VWA domain-containing protein [Pseudonocardia oceani]